MRCDLCGIDDETVVEIENPYHARDLRASTHRRHHLACEAAVKANRAAEDARTSRELDRRIDALYAPTV